MATFNHTGAEDFLRELAAYGEKGAAAIEPVLRAGGDAAIELLEQTTAWHDRTGELRAAMVQSKQVQGEGSASYIEVYPDGETHDKKPQRLAEIGFVLEYGRTNMPPRPWMRPAIEGHSTEISQAMQEKWEALGDG